MKKKNKKKNKQSIIMLVLLFLLIVFLDTAITRAIYRQTLGTSVILNVFDPTTYFEVKFNTHGGVAVAPQMVANDEAIGDLPTTSKDNYSFVGWYTEENGGTKINRGTKITGNITYHAHYVKLVCKAAPENTLHEEECKRTSDGCHSAGIAQGENITYGNYPNEYSPRKGDAYDCDVNNDNVFDSETERFYYLRETEDNNAVLVFHANYSSTGRLTGLTSDPIFLYDAGLEVLPDSDTWSNPALITQSNGKISRYINKADLEATCGNPMLYDSNGTNYLVPCYYYLEKTKFQDADVARSGIWIEMVDSQRYRIDTRTNKVSSVKATSENGVRPVIEIPREAVEGYTEKTMYKVSFNSHGGPSISDEYVYEEETLNEFPSPKWENHVLEGFYEDEDFLTPFDIETPITSDTVIHVHWEYVENSFPIVFEQEGECVFDGDTGVISGEECGDYVGKTYIDTGISLFSKENYKKDFEIGFKIVSYNSNNQDHNQATFLNSKLENSTIYYPGFVFRKNGSSYQLTEKIEGVEASVILPHHDGYSYKIVRKDNVIYYSVNDGELIELQDMSNFIHFFNLTTWFGAYSPESNVEATGENSTAARHIRATMSNMYIKLEVTTMTNQVKVIFDAGDGGTSSIDSIEINKNSSLGENYPTATKENGIFVGWFTEAEGGTEITAETPIPRNIKVYAHYIPASAVTFDAEGGTMIDNDEPVSTITKVVETDTAIGDLPVPTKEGFVFRGWFTEAEGGTEYKEETVITGNITLHAQYTSLVTITFNAGDGTPSFATKYVEMNTMIGELPTATLEGYVLDAWYEDDSWTTEITPETIITGEKQLVAKWAEGTKVAKYNGQYYDTVQLAVDNVTGSGKAVIKILQDAEGTTTISDGKHIEFDIQNFTLSSSTTNVLVINEGCTVEIKNGTIATTASCGAINNNAGATLKISGGTITGTAKQAVYNDGGTLIISGNAQLKNTTSTNRAALHNHGGSITILGGKIESEKWHAVRNEIGTLVIGTNDGFILTDLPEIKGAKNGVLADVEFEFYDGAIMGKSGAISDETKAILKKGTKITKIKEDDYHIAHIERENLLTITFNAKGGTASKTSIQIITGSAIGTLPTASKANTNFAGWFTEEDGGERITKDTIMDSSTEVYAHYSDIVCKRATSNSLHSSGNITYGQVQSGPIIKVGDAYNCDVNGDSEYSDSTERFYYLTNDEDGNAIFIYYNNTTSLSDIPMCSATGLNYNSSANNIGPIGSYTELPYKSLWNNVYLSNGGRRQIVNNNGGSTTSAGIIGSFTYTDRSARYATTKEIEDACGIKVSVNNPQAGELNSCEFLLENVGGSCLGNYWLETPVSSSSTNAFVVDASSMILNTNTTAGSRPVIEVPLELVEVEKELVEFDTIPTAMRNYFDNISTWAFGQTDSSHAQLDSYMTTNLDSNDCVYFTGDNRNTEHLSTYCDQPKKYDTGVSGLVNVYEYDIETRTTKPATYVSSDTGKLYNMIPNTIYYWESNADPSVHGYVKALGERRIISIDNSPSNPLHKIRNVRDLGGISVQYVDENNKVVTGKIKYGKIYRGEKIWSGDGNATQYFTKLGITHEMDLRANNEPVTSEEDDLQYKITSNPNDPNVKTFEIIHYGIDYGGYDVTTNGNTVHYDYYDLSRDALTRVMQEFVNAGENSDYALFFHCRIGADRTGTLAYLIEGILGASEEERYRDYELTVFYGLRERTRFYENKSTNHIKFNHLKQAIRNATPNNTTGVEDVVAWYLKGSSNPTADMKLINDFRNLLVDKDQ